MSWQALSEVLKAGGTVLVPGRRLARRLIALWDETQAREGKTAWESPPVLTWDAWLERLWEEGVVAGTLEPASLLTPEEERAVWESVLGEEGTDVSDVRGMAALAAEAYALAREWDIAPPGSGEGAGPEIGAFRRWMGHFEARSVERGWLSSACLVDALAERPETLDGAVGRPVLLYGFERITPAQERLLRAYETRGGTWSHLWPLGERGARAVRVTAADPSDEARLAARWIRSRLEARPGCRLGLVVAGLGARRREIVRALDEVLVPALPLHADRTRPFLVEAALPLAESPLVRAALALLALAVQGEQPLEVVSGLLRFPHLAGWSDEAGRRASLDRMLRESGLPGPSLAAVARMAARKGDCPRLAAAFRVLEAEVAAWPEADTPGEWARRFARALERAGWARGRPLDASELAAAEAWRGALAGLARQEATAGGVTAREALEALREIVGGCAFDPPSPGDAPVTVLDLNDAMAAIAGFDGLWVMGLDDTVWPPAVNPNPFLPPEAQRGAGIPQASVVHALERARRITAALAAAAPEVVFSHAAMVEDGERGPSSLIARHREVRRDGLGVWEEATFVERLAEEDATVVADDVPPPPVPAGEVRGGSYLLKLQSGCPFRAFAELRLRADAPEAVDLGPDQMLRGGLVHDLLEHVWEEIGDQGTLAQLDDKALEALVRRHAEHVAEAAGREHPQLYPTTFRRLEVERLVRLALRWLAVERSRTPFVVAYREKEYEAELEGLTFRLRVDRIDRLPDGRHVVIDYKTGQVDPRDWVGDRPADPQLPLYASVLDGRADVLGERLSLAGVAYARVHMSGPGFSGVACEAGLLPGAIQKDLGVSIAAWSETLRALAREFRVGHAPVRPRDDDACKWCALPALCRIDEARSGRGAEPPEEVHDGAE